MIEALKVFSGVFLVTIIGAIMAFVSMWRERHLK
jgi:hypothetical protein